MKKIKLFLAAMAAMVTMGVQAQTWTASEVGAGNFMLYNVGTGQYLTKGNGWGTQASITTAATAGNGFAVALEAVGTNFKIRTNINGDGKGLEHLSGGTIYTDQSNGKNSTWTFTQVGTDNGPIYTIVSADNHGGGSGVYLTAGVDGTIVTPGSDGTIDGAKWKLMSIPAQPIGMADASETNPVDATSLIVNANFSFPAILKDDSWTMVSGNYNACGGDVTNPNAESWRASFTLSQTITVPNGIYELTAQAAVTEYTVTGADLPVVYANEESTPFTAMTDGEDSMGKVSTSFTAGKYVVGPISVVVTNGSLTIGVRGTRSDTWCVWDNFKLTYKGIDLSALRDALQAQIDAVPALEGTTTTAAYNAAKNYADGIDMDALTTEEAISAASTELSTRVNAAKALQAGYAYTLKAKALYDQTNYSEKVANAKADFKAVLDAVEEKTTVADVNAANAAIPAALATFMGKIEFDENAYFEITDFFLTNADFSAGNIEGWETNYVSGQQAQNIGYQGASYTNGDVRISQFIEAWRPGATLGDGYLRQTVQGLPEGKFVLEADAISTWQNDDSRQITGAQLFITADGVTYKTDMSTKNGAPKHFSTEFLNTGAGDVLFGLRTVSTNCNWLCADNFKVTFYGIDLSPYATLLAEAVAEAQAIDASTLTSAAATALSTAVSDNNKTWSTAKEYTTAIAAIQAATDEAKAVAAALVQYNNKKAIVEALKNVQGYTETVDGATTTFDAAISTADTNVDAAATAADVAAQEAALIAAAKTFLAGVRSDGEHAFDITFFITNPGFDNNNIDGWTRTYENGTATTRAQVNEFYQATFDFYQTLTDMPKGNYELKVQAFQRLGDCQTDFTGYMNGTLKPTSVIYINEGTSTIKACAADATDANIYEGDKEVTYESITKYEPFSMEGAALRFSQGLYDNTVLTAVEGTLKLGFKSTADPVAGDWTIFDNFRLYYYGQSINVAMDEAVAFSALADIEGANVTMARKSKIGYNTVALPFDLTVAQVETVFGAGAVVYAFSENSADPNDATVNFNSKSENTIEANVPVLVKATAEANQIVADNVTVKTGAAKVEGTNFDFVGNYGGQITLADGIWFVGNDALYKSAGSTKMKGFRAYIEPKTATTAPVKLYIDGLETAIEEINGEAVENGVIYNLAGQRVNKAQKGIYIQNGKKVLVK